MSFVAGERGRLVVANTHDGVAIADHERAALVVEARDDALVLRVDAPFHGDPPPGAPVGPTPRLWEHEVVEVMILGPGERYLEVELGPHGHHLVLELVGVREAVRQGHALTYEARIEGRRWRGEAIVPRSLLPPDADRLNAFAIHGAGDARRHLAWRAPNVPGEMPDFHRLEAFGRWSDVRPA